MKTEKDVPTLSEYQNRFNRPNYFDDVRTPKEMIDLWYKRIEDSYYEKYGQEKIVSLRRTEK